MISTQDWHPADHISFFSNLGLRQLDPTWLSVNNTNVADISMFDEVDIYSIYTIYLQLSILSKYTISTGRVQEVSSLQTEAVARSLHSGLRRSVSMSQIYKNIYYLLKNILLFQEPSSTRASRPPRSRRLSRRAPTP